MAKPSHNRRRRRRHANKCSYTNSENSRSPEDAKVPSPEVIWSNEVELAVTRRSLLCSIAYHINEGGNYPMVQPSRELSRLLDLHTNWKRLKGEDPPSIDDNVFGDTVLYALVYLSFYWKVEDSFTVSLLLRRFFESHGNFMFLFQNPLRHPFAIWDEHRPLGLPSRPTRGSHDKRAPFVFFAEHATRTRLLLRGIPFMDLRLNHPAGFRPSPVYLSASVGELSLLRYLLQRGANLGRNPEHKSWVASLIVKLLSNAARYGALKALPESRFVDVNKLEGGKSEIACTRLLLRAVAPININHLEFRPNSFCKNLFPSTSAMAHALSNNGLVPKLKYRCVEPSELKHMCRITIREQLRKKWQLPHGITQLPLPSILKDYVNLEED